LTFQLKLCFTLSTRSNTPIPGPMESKVKIQKILSQHRNDFSAAMECEHCGATQKLIGGYDDANYHGNVIPAMKCKACGRSRNDARLAPPLRQTVIYFVLVDHGPKLGLAWAERDPARMSKEHTLADMIGGQFAGDIRQILEVEVEFAADGLSSRDVTEWMMLCQHRHEHNEPQNCADRIRADRFAWVNDHNHDLRKNEETV
jgi:hypothetical protein